MKNIYSFIHFLIGISTIAFSQEATFELAHIATYETGIFDEGAAEIVAYDKSTQRLYFTNAKDMSISILDISNPATPTLIGNTDMTPYGGDVNSVAVHNGLVAVAVAAVEKTQAGVVIFLDADGNFVQRVSAGALPDMLTFNHAGDKVIVANEGEPNDDYTVDPVGSISIIDLFAGVQNAKVFSLSLDVYKNVTDALRNNNIRLFGPNATAGQDLEPEYIAVSEDDKIAYVSCQENNAIIKVDLERNAILNIHGLGYKDHNLPGNELDASDKNEQINIRNWDVLGMYQLKFQR